MANKSFTAIIVIAVGFFFFSLLMFGFRGDRRTQLVFIGVNLNKDAIHEKLNAALLTEQESATLGGMKGWRTLKDPFYNGQLPDHHFEYNSTPEKR